VTKYFTDRGKHAAYFCATHEVIQGVYTVCTRIICGILYRTLSFFCSHPLLLFRVTSDLQTDRLSKHVTHFMEQRPSLGPSSDSADR
jgi:hypothetical protein